MPPAETEVCGQLRTPAGCGDQKFVTVAGVQRLSAGKVNQQRGQGLREGQRGDAGPSIPQDGVFASLGLNVLGHQTLSENRLPACPPSAGPRGCSREQDGHDSYPHVIHIQTEVQLQRRSGLSFWGGTRSC